MKSGLIKVAHEVGGQPIVRYVCDAVSQLRRLDGIMMVVGYQADVVRQVVNDDRVQYVMQEAQLGTGHAVLQAESHMDLKEDEHVLVLAGDVPLIQANTLNQLVDTHIKDEAFATVLTADIPDAGTYGRILRDSGGDVVGIREAKDCTPEEKRITEFNTGIYLFRSQALFSALKGVNTENSQGEYYLTDVIEGLQKQGRRISALCIADVNEIQGINTRMDLAKVNQVIYDQTNEQLMASGVTLLDPSSTFIDRGVEIGQDTIIYPFCVIQGASKIGKNCVIRSHQELVDQTIPDNKVVS